MRVWWAVVAVVVAALVPVEELRTALAGAASVLFEAVPFVVLAALLRRILPVQAVAFAGCGCTPGPSARSIPAAIATWLSFGPAVALGRFAAACAVALAMVRREPPSHDCADAPGVNVLAELRALVPPAIAAGAIQCLQTLAPERMAPWLQFVSGAVAGCVCAPCGIGTVALATALHARAPFAGAGLLCTAGIVDLRSFARAASHASHDALGYAALGVACVAIGLHRGSGFVHPALGATLLPCAAFALVAFARFRNAANGAIRIAPAIMLAGAFAGSPAPLYRATETTMNGLFAGERLQFTGTVVRRNVVERYAITCCRADAMPVAVRCVRNLAFADGTWVRANGTIVVRNGEFLLDVAAVSRIPAPADPFVYR